MDFTKLPRQNSWCVNLDQGPSAEQHERLRVWRDRLSNEVDGVKLKWVSKLPKLRE